MFRQSKPVCFGASAVGLVPTNVPCFSTEPHAAAPPASWREIGWLTKWRCRRSTAHSLCGAPCALCGHKFCRASLHWPRPTKNNPNLFSATLWRRVFSATRQSPPAQSPAGKERPRHPEPGARFAHHASLGQTRRWRLDRG